jgi:hypothetical protein
MLDMPEIDGIDEMAPSFLNTMFPLTDSSAAGEAHKISSF